MTRIRFKVPRAITLLQLLVALAGLFLLLVPDTRAELEFFQDDEPKLPEVNIQRLMRYLELKRHSHQKPHLFPQQVPAAAAAPQPGLPAVTQLEQLERLAQLQEQERQEEFEQAHLKQLHQQHLLELARQKQRGLLRDDLPERPNVLDVLQREAVDPLVYVHELDRQRLLPYLGLEYEAKPRIKPYSVEEEARAQLLPAPMNKDPLLDYPETQYEDVGGRPRHQLEKPRHVMDEVQHRHRPIVPFTYTVPKLEPIDPNAPPPFAVRPNDPRYYQEDDDASYQPVHQEHHESAKHKQQVEHHADKVEHKHQVKSEMNTPKPRQKVVKLTHEEDQPRSNYVQMNMLPEPQRRAEQDPMVVSLSYKNPNDVYYIAVVAGISAAVVFAFVLVGLTFCRFRRTAKQAQDVDYPAYGVTGPNKDMSPSGDQRLAQSAQMYHFQHQKQQIIAMENRASAARDPGSVSEAESDEENEEGDYTVYECPGLAPTAEMEVKNPLFDDDPTPATPAKSKRNGDV